jgi:hypothetical protein
MTQIMAVGGLPSAVTLPKSYVGDKNLVKFEGYTLVSQPDAI